MTDAPIRAIAHRAWMRHDEVIGVREGWVRLLGEGNAHVLANEEVSGILHLGGTVLGSSRGVEAGRRSSTMNRW